MKKLNLLIVILAFCSAHLSAQEKSTLTKYREYFKIPREAIFVHSNKTTYLKNEDIWFQTYAFDRKNGLPSKKTTNIYVGLYDSIGNQIDKRLFYSKDGIATGHLKVDTLLVSGTYYLKASTNWMKNFKEDDSFVQKIEILNSKSPFKRKVSDKKFDLQFLPEGGHMVSDIKNVVGFKYLNDQGKGASISGSIYDNENKLITNFKSNALGMGKFSIIPEAGKSYVAKFSLDGNAQEIVYLPKTEDLGLTLNVNNLRKNQTIVGLSANKKSFEQFKGKELELLIHRDGLLKSIKFTMNTDVIVIPITKSDLFTGINILTVLDTNGEPLLERIIFNNNSFSKFPLVLSEVKSDFDSVHYSLRNIKPLNDDEIVNFSVSVLPSETKSYNPDQNIVSSILIEPYIKGDLENPNFYFKDFGVKNHYDLDLLLLTQGWSKYSWDNIKQGQNELLYDFESGISFNGTVNSSLRNVNEFVIYPTKYNPSGFLKTDEKGKFSINNYYVERGEEVRFSAVMNNGKMRRPIINLSPIKRNAKDAVATNRLALSLASYYTDKNGVPDNFVRDGFEALDEVTIVVKKKERLRDPQFPNAKITQVTENIARQYPNITDFIQQNGFNVFDGTTNGLFLGQIRIENRGRGLGASPVLFVDGVLMSDFNILQTITMDKVDKILIDRSGVGLGISGGNAFGGVIKITTRNTSLLSPSLTSPDIFSSRVTHGFEPTKEFYVPKYPSYSTQSYKDYGIIHWESNASLKNGENFKFKTINTQLDEVKFFIEGMSSDGRLISQIITLDTKESN